MMSGIGTAALQKQWDQWEKSIDRILNNTEEKNEPNKPEVYLKITRENLQHLMESKQFTKDSLEKNLSIGYSRHQNKLVTSLDVYQNEDPVQVIKFKYTNFTHKELYELINKKSPPRTHIPSIRTPVSASNIVDT